MAHRKMPTSQAFALFGLQEDASLDDVKARYRQLALHHHPDKVKDEDKAAANFKMAKINAANELLQQIVSERHTRLQRTDRKSNTNAFSGEGPRPRSGWPFKPKWPPAGADYSTSQDGDNERTSSSSSSTSSNDSFKTARSHRSNDVSPPPTKTPEPPRVADELRSIHVNLIAAANNINTMCSTKFPQMPPSTSFISTPDITACLTLLGHFSEVIRYEIQYIERKIQNGKGSFNNEPFSMDGVMLNRQKTLASWVKDIYSMWTKITAFGDQNFYGIEGTDMTEWWKWLEKHRADYEAKLALSVKQRSWYS